MRTQVCYKRCKLVLKLLSVTYSFNYFRTILTFCSVFIEHILVVQMPKTSFFQIIIDVVKCLQNRLRTFVAFFVVFTKISLQASVVAKIWVQLRVQLVSEKKCWESARSGCTRQQHMVCNTYLEDRNKYL